MARQRALTVWGLGEGRFHRVQVGEQEDRNEASRSARAAAARGLLRTLKLPRMTASPGPKSLLQRIPRHKANLERNRRKPKWPVDWEAYLLDYRSVARAQQANARTINCASV